MSENQEKTNQQPDENTQNTDNVSSFDTSVSNPDTMLESINNVKNLMKSGYLDSNNAINVIQNIIQQSIGNLELSLPQNSITEDVNPAESEKFEPAQETSNSSKYPELMDYLKNSGNKLSDKDFAVISSLVKDIETKAVERYQKKLNHNSYLTGSNETAKRRLTSYAQNSSNEVKSEHSFTRQEIGAMTREEFDKNEKQIMYQLSRGMIK